MFARPTLLIAGASAYSMSTLFSALKPVLLARFVEEAGYSEALAGLLVAMPFVGIACASLVMNALLARLSIRSLVVVFGLLLVAGELVSAWLFHLAIPTIAVQFTCGVAVGVLMGASSQVIATEESPGPIFGFVDMVAVLAMSVMIYGAGRAVGLSGLNGAYLYAAAVSLILVALMLVYKSTASTQHESREVVPLQFSRRAIAVVLMAVLFVTSSGLGFAFMFAIALDLGMTYETAGQAIGILLFVSALGCLAGGWAAAKFGPLRPLALAYVCCGLGWVIAIYAATPTIFFVGLIPAIFALQFNYPILLTLSGSLDDTGRWAAVATPLQASGFAWAAIIAGTLVSGFGIPMLAIATAVGMLLCLGLLILARQ